MLITPDDKMIQYTHIHQTERLDQSTGNVTVRLAGSAKPEGWLWARITALALTCKERLTTSRG